MDPEQKKLLEETFELAKENNAILSSVRRSIRVSTILSVIYWVIILGSVFGVYYLLQPYWHQIVAVFQNANTLLKDFNQLGH